MRKYLVTALVAVIAVGLVAMVWGTYRDVLGGVPLAARPPGT